MTFSQPFSQFTFRYLTFWYSTSPTEPSSLLLKSNLEVGYCFPMLENDLSCFPPWSMSLLVFLHENNLRETKNLKVRIHFLEKYAKKGRGTKMQTTVFIYSLSATEARNA